jgi:NAD(P)-dependent dehydrogenase (short-subunit alcohol dehydrogenase family)
MSLNPRIDDWNGRVAWIVGASNGIGRAVAEQLHGAGAQVVASARKADALAELARARARIEPLALDATDRAAFRAAAQGIVERHGRIDFVLYCAGHYLPQRATAFDLDQMLRHLDVNLVGAYHCLDAVLPALLRQAQAGQPAHLSLVGSVAGYRGLPNALAYGPTKAALINLAEVLFLDLRPKGVGVSIVNPGFVETTLTAQNTFTMPALIKPAEAARAMRAGWAAGQFEIHFPKRFTRALKALRLLGDGAYFAAIRRATGL